MMRLPPIWAWTSAASVNTAKPPGRLFRLIYPYRQPDVSCYLGKDHLGSHSSEYHIGIYAGGRRK